MSKGYKITKEEFIEKSNIIHNNKYDYSLVDFKVVKDIITIICPIHGQFQQKVVGHMGGSECQKCAKIKSLNKKSTKLEDIILKSKNKYGNNFEFDETSYSSLYKTMRIKCKKHGWQIISPHFHLKSKNGCKECNSMKLDFNEFINRSKYIHGNKYDYSECAENYNGAVKKVSIICPIHGSFKMAPRQHYIGQGCPQCAKQIISSKNLLTLQEFILKSNLKHKNKYDYSKSIYVKKNADVLITCKKHGDFWQRAENHWNGAGCPSCSNIGKSKQEKEVLYFIKEIYTGNIIENARNIIDDFEIDIYLPDLNLGIEYNGLYWHSEDKRGKTYHLDKTNQAEKIGINILHIFSNEWEQKPDIWKSIIKNKLCINDKIVYARNCDIKSISSEQSKLFLNENHLQGNINSSIKYGLFHNNELISIMTFGKSRFNKKYEYEIHRLCTKINYRVIGGASKLFSHFIKDYNPNSIISYCDKRYANGKVYNKLGFILQKISKPNYWYTKNNLEILSRICFQKHKLKNKLKNYNSNLTEWENMKNNGWNRIWDCGNFVFIWNKI